MVTTGERDRQGHVFELLFELSRIVADGGAPSDLLARVAGAAASAARTPSAHALLADDTSGGQLAASSHGVARAEDRQALARAAERARTTAAAVSIPDSRADAELSGAATLRSILALPLVAEGTPIGAVAVGSPRAGGVPDEDARSLAYLAASVVKDLESARLYNLAITDPLTRVFNRQYLYQRLPAELERARRYAVPFAAVLLDVDGLHDINERHGFAAGDEVLRAVARICRAELREIDAVARYGGEGFFLFLPHTDRAGAEVTGGRVREAVASASIVVNGQAIPVTATCAVVVHEPETDAPGLLRDLEAALQAAKQLRP